MGELELKNQSNKSRFFLIGNFLALLISFCCMQPAYASNVSPAISGDHAVGQVLTLDKGSIWDSSESVQIQWLRDFSPIQGANSTSYTQTSEDFGKSITAELKGLVNSVESVRFIAPNVRTSAGSYSPTLGSTFITSISSGAATTCVTHLSGFIQCVGNNSAGQLGDGTLISKSSPSDVVGIHDAIDVTVGSDFGCALKSGGLVSCWGRTDSFHSLGSSNSGVVTSTPVILPGIQGAVQIDAGYRHVCVLDANSSVTCFGFNGPGMGMGNGNHATPTWSVGGLSGVTNISAGGYQNCAEKIEGSVYCWGDTGEETGDGLSVFNATPTVKVGLSNVSSVSIGAFNSCAVNTSGDAYCWGTGLLLSVTPSKVPLDKQVIQVTAGDLHVCALLSDFSVACWGRNSSGQLGNGSLNASDSPAEVPNLQGVKELSNGSDYSCAMKIDMTSSCWGGNDYGQISNSDATSIQEPIASVGYLDRLESNVVPRVLVGTPTVGSTISIGQINLPPYFSKSFQWLVDGSTIPSEQNNSILLNAQNAGHSIGARVSLVANGYQQLQANTYSLQVLKGAITPSSIQVVGQFKVKKKLTASTSAWIPGATKTYAWYRDAKKIKGANKSSYTLTSLDRGHKISVQISEALEGYNSASLKSKASKVK